MSSPTPCCETLQQQHPNNSKQNGALAGWRHAGGARDLQSATVFPESCHSVTVAKVLLFGRAAPSAAISPRNFSVGCCANEASQIDPAPARSIFHVFSIVEALLHLEFRHWALAASYAKKQRPYDDVTGHLKVEKALTRSSCQAECCRPFKSCRSGRTQE